MLCGVACTKVKKEQKNLEPQVFKSSTTVVDVFLRTRNDLFLECCQDKIKYCQNSCRLKTSTPHMPKHDERACQRAQK